MKRCGFDHPKVGRLCRLLSVPRYSAIGIVESLWHFTAKHATAGDVGKWSNDEIAVAIGWDGEPDGLIVALVEARFLDEIDGPRLIVHDWPVHCEDGIHNALARRGEFFANGEAPRLTRLSKNEREQIESLYRVGESALSAHKSTQKRSANAQPSQAKPCPAKPSQATPDRVRRSATRSGVLTNLDVSDVGRVLGWLEAKLSGKASDDQRIFALAASRAAVRSGKDPPALFVSIVNENKRTSVTNDDMDWASQAFRDYLATSAVTEQLRRKD